MARKVFFSFHYLPDCSRASQVRNMGALEGNAPVSDNDWETVKKNGDAGIEKWIKGQLVGRSCTVVLIGENTAGRKWINHEISESWNANMGVVGIRIHNLKNLQQMQSGIGGNPFDYVTFTATQAKLSSVVSIYNPSGNTSTEVYASIKNNIAAWVEKAIEIRKAN